MSSNPKYKYIPKNIEILFTPASTEIQEAQIDAMASLAKAFFKDKKMVRDNIIPDPATSKIASGE